MGIKSRRGVGIVVMVMVLLVLSLGLWGLVLAMQTSQGADQGRRVVLGATAQAYAESAVAEVWARMERAAADAGSPVGQALRTALVAGSQDPVEAALDAALAPATSPAVPAMTLARLSHHYRLATGRVRVTVADRARLQRSSPVNYESAGVVVLSATVETNECTGKRVTRTVEERREIRTILAGPPRPFDQLSFFVHEATDAVTTSDTAIGVLQAAAPGWARIWQALARGTGSADLSAQATRIEDLARRAAALRRLPAPATGRYSLASKACRIPDLSILGVPSGWKRIQPGLEELSSWVEENKGRADELAAGLGSGGGSLPLEVLARFQAMIEAVTGMVSSQEQYQDLFAPLDQGRIESHGFKLDLKHWRAKALYRSGPDSIRETTLSVARRPARGGVVWVAPAAGTTDISGLTLEGTQVLVLEGNSRISNLACNLPSRSTVVFGGCLEVSGEVQAALVGCQGSHFRTQSGARIQGSLVLVDYPVDLSGELVHVPEHFSGISRDGGMAETKLDHLLVTFGPYPVGRSVRWN